MKQTLHRRNQGRIEKQAWKCLFGLLAIIGVLITSNVAAAYDYKVNDIYYNVLSVKDRTAEVSNNGYTTGTAYAGNIDIPSSFIIPDTDLEFSVVKIGNAAFKHCKDVTSVRLPNTITEIDDEAFYDCVLMKTIHTPKQLESIGASAFQYCTYLSDFELTSTVKSIGAKAFANCKSLKTVTIPESVETLGSSVYADCTALTSVKFANGLNVLPNSLFSGCTHLTDVELSSSVKTIGISAFQGCSALEELIMPYVLSIGDKAFMNCTSLKNIDLSSNLNTLGRSVFSGCKNLIKFEVPDAVREIKDALLDDCSSLEELTIGKSVANISNTAFNGCTALKTINCYPIVPPVGAIFSTNNYLTATLHVVDGYKESYSDALGWRDFLKIKEDLTMRQDSEGVARVYFKNAPNYIWDNIYVFGSDGNNSEAAWPGSVMSKYRYDGEDIWTYAFYYIVPDIVVFHTLNTSGQTKDFSFIDNGVYTQEGYVGQMPSSGYIDTVDSSLLEEILSIVTQNGIIVINCAKAMDIDVISLDGIRHNYRLQAGANMIDNLAAGVYIINGHKIII